MWTALSEKKCMICEVPLNRWDSDSIIASIDARAPGRDSVYPSLNRIKFGGILDEDTLEGFNASLFGISELEALHMDKSQKLLLEVCYESFLDAGYTKATLKGQLAGVFVAAIGTFESDATGTLDLDSNSSVSELSVYDVTGKNLSVSSGRISYLFGLHGPCITVDTACSSSVVALHNAKRSLQLGECDMAVVAGVQIMTSMGSIS